MRKKLCKILITGGAGFIGSEFVRQMCQTGYKVSVVDKLTYAGDKKRLDSVKKKYTFHKIDICNKPQLNSVFNAEKPSIVVHFAAETHVDRSIIDANPFIQTNLQGTQNLIEISRKYKINKFIHISTDEIYGESKKGRFKENSIIQPGNPYAATKAAAELLVTASIRTYTFPAIIVRPANNYGPWQYPEKFIPVIILKALKGQKIPVYGKGKQIREWLHVSDCAAGITLLLNKGRIGEIYNIGSYFERENIITAKTILKQLGKKESQIQFVKDRPGHDFRYSVNCTKIRNLGWRPQINFPAGIKHTLDWYLNNIAWTENKLDTLEKYWKKVYRT